MPVEITDDFRLVGHEIEFDQAPDLIQRGRTLLNAAHGELAVDCQALERANSVTVAVLLAWYRAAHEQGVDIVFVNISQKLRNIISFSGLSDVLVSA